MKKCAEKSAIWYPMDGRTYKWQLYFSTDDSMDGREVLDYYRTGFQLEFCFRDESSMQESPTVSLPTSGNWIILHLHKYYKILGVDS